MKKLFTFFILIFLSQSLQAQITAEFTWCPVYDTTNQICCIQFENLSIDSAGAINMYFWSTGDGGSSTIADPRWCYSFIGTYVVMLIVNGPSGADTVTHSVTINHLDTTDCNCDSLIGLNEIDPEDFSFSFSPNPFQEKTVLNWKIKGGSSVHLTPAEIRIYNSYGTLVHFENVHWDESQFILDRKDLPAGMYIFNILSGDKIRIGTGKFIIH